MSGRPRSVPRQGDRPWSDDPFEGRQLGPVADRQDEGAQLADHGRRTGRALVDLDEPLEREPLFIGEESLPAFLDGPGEASTPPIAFRCSCAQSAPINMTVTSAPASSVLRFRRTTWAIPPPTQVPTATQRAAPRTIAAARNTKRSAGARWRSKRKAQDTSSRSSWSDSARDADVMLRFFERGWGSRHHPRRRRRAARRRCGRRDRRVVPPDGHRATGGTRRSGVYYGSGTSEARAVEGGHVYVVGGAKSLPRQADVRGTTSYVTCSRRQLVCGTTCRDPDDTSHMPGGRRRRSEPARCPCCSGRSARAPA